MVFGGLRWSPVVFDGLRILRLSRVVFDGLRCSPVDFGGFQWSLWVS